MTRITFGRLARQLEAAKYSNTESKDIVGLVCIISMALKSLRIQTDVINIKQTACRGTVHTERQACNIC